MTPAQAARAAQHITALRGLYRRLSESLDDGPVRRELWEEISIEHAKLNALLRGDADVGTPD